jgi:hypothetical protein
MLMHLLGLKLHFTTRTPKLKRVERVSHFSSELSQPFQESGSPTTGTSACLFLLKLGYAIAAEVSFALLAIFRCSIQDTEADVALIVVFEPCFVVPTLFLR